MDKLYVEWDNPVPLIHEMLNCWKSTYILPDIPLSTQQCLAVRWCRTICDMKVCSQLFYRGAGDRIISEVAENQAPIFSLQNRKLILFLWCLSITPVLAVNVSIIFPTAESRILNTTLVKDWASLKYPLQKLTQKNTVSFKRLQCVITRCVWQRKLWVYILTSTSLTICHNIAQ